MRLRDLQFAAYGWTACAAANLVHSAFAQDIGVTTPAGAINVDTGNDWMDFLFVVVILALITVAVILIRRLSGRDNPDER